LEKEGFSLSFSILHIAIYVATIPSAKGIAAIGSAIEPMAPAINPAYFGEDLRKLFRSPSVITFPSFLDDCSALSFPDLIQRRTVSGFVFNLDSRS